MDDRGLQFITVAALDDLGPSSSPDFEMLYFSRPCVDSRKQFVYVPCNRWTLSESSPFLEVFHFNNKQLIKVKSLSCVEKPVSVAVNPYDSNSVFVCSGVRNGSGVSQINVIENRVMLKIQAPAGIERPPRHVAVLKQTVLVVYGSTTLAMYHKYGTTPGREFQIPAGMHVVSSLTTDTRSNFLVTTSDALFILNTKGELFRATLPRNALPKRLIGCAVTQSQLLLGYACGSITVLSSL